MLWVIVWAVLVIGWLLGAFFGLRWLWRRVKALAAELETLSDVAERLSAALDARPPAPPAPGPSVGAGAEGPRARLAVLREARAERRAAKAGRRAARYAEWDRLAGRRA